ncbi:FluG domain-containing protein [Xylaria cf. heliscus]|nr:FluG domain-containing protein [Xylaria cf. heliscus]
MPSTTIAVRTRARTNGAPDHPDFPRRVANKEADSRVIKRPAPLSTRQHAAHHEQLRPVQYIKQKYAIETEINATGIFGKWKRYCAEMVVGDWKLTIESLDRETLIDSSLFVWENYKTKSRGSSQEYIRRFSRPHTTSAGRYVDRNRTKELYKEISLIYSQYHDPLLLHRFSIRPPDIDGKPVLNVDSLRVILVYNIAYDTPIYPLELHCLNFSGCYQILCYTGTRPAELVDNEKNTKAVMSAEGAGGDGEDEEDEEDSSDRRNRPKALCYENILMMVVRHPVTGQAIPAMAITFSKTLFFCPLLLGISLALFDNAFDANCLIDARSVLGAKIPYRVNCLPLRWKESKLKLPVLRRTHRGTMSRDKATSYFKLRDDMGHQSLDTGFGKKWTPRFAGRGTANAGNGNAPDPIRDQMMPQTPEICSFQNACLNQIADFDLQNAFLEEETQDQLFRLFTHLSLTRDPCAKRDMLSDEIRTNLEPAPDIDEAKIRELTHKIGTKRAQREDRIMKEYREYYFYNLPAEDLERQAGGEDMDEYAEPPIDLGIPERTQLAELLFDQYGALGGKRDTVKRNRTRLRSQVELVIRTGPTTVETVLEPDPEPEPDPFPLLMQPTQCPDCIGDKAQTIPEPTFHYCRPTKRNDHFDDRHLEGKERAEKQGELIVCRHPKFSEVKLRSVDAFGTHIQSIHGVVLRSSAQVQERRTRKAGLRRP